MKFFALAFALSLPAASFVAIAEAANTETGGYEVIANGFSADISSCPQAAKNVRDIVIDPMKVEIVEMSSGSTLEYGVLDPLAPETPLMTSAGIPLPAAYRKWRPGRPVFGNITFEVEGGARAAHELAHCVQQGAGGVRPQLKIVLFKSDKTPGRSYTFTLSGASECKGKGPQTGCVHATVSDGSFGSTERTTNQSSFGTMVRIGDSDGKISPADPAWDSISAETPELEACAAPSAKFKTNSPGHKTVGEITLRGAMTDGRKALCEWINDTVSGKPWKRTFTITELLSVDGAVKDGKQYRYSDCFPVSYSFPSFKYGAVAGAHRDESVALKCNGPRQSVSLDCSEDGCSSQSTEEVRIKPIRCELK